MKHYMIHCNDACSLSKTLHFRNKNDELDSAGLAMLWSLLQDQAERWFKNKLITPASNASQELKSLYSHTITLKKKIKKDKQHKEAILSDAFASEKMLQHISLSIQLVERQLKETQTEILRLLNELKLRGKFELLQTIPWVWPQTATTLVVFFQDLVEKGFTNADSKKMVAYAWLDPTQKQSWTSISSSHLSRKGNKFVRSAMYMIWMQRSQHMNHENYSSTNIWKFAQRMKIKFKSWNSKRWKSMLCAIWRKILTISRAIYNSGKPYDFR